MTGLGPRTHIRADKAIIGDGERVVADAWVTIEGSAIVSISSERPTIGANDTVVTLPGRTLTPGLVNLHDHIPRKHLRKLNNRPDAAHIKRRFWEESPQYQLLHGVRNAREALNQGVTMVRDFGLSDLAAIHLSRAIDEGVVEGPTMIACGRPICITGGHTYRFAYEADGAEGVAAAVRLQLREGARVIKLMASGGLEGFPDENIHHVQMTEHELRAAVETAGAAGVATAVHAIPSGAILNAARAGVTTIEHGVFLSQDGVEAMLESGTSLVPTLSGIRAGRSGKGFDAIRERLVNEVYEPHSASVRRASAAGILVGVGTDSAGTVAEEVRLLAEILEEEPVRAIARATGVSATILGRADIGLLEPGRRATIAAFVGDLESDLDGLDRADAVWQDGRLTVWSGDLDATISNEHNARRPHTL